MNWVCSLGASQYFDILISLETLIVPVSTTIIYSPVWMKKWKRNQKLLSTSTINILMFFSTKVTFPILKKKHLENKFIELTVQQLSTISTHVWHPVNSHVKLTKNFTKSNNLLIWDLYQRTPNQHFGAFQYCDNSTKHVVYVMLIASSQQKIVATSCSVWRQFST